MHPANLSDLHRQFQQTLLTLLRDEEIGENLDDLRVLSLRLHELVRTQPGKTFWRSVIGALDGVETTGARLPAETLRLLGGVERSISTWILDGESCFMSEAHAALAANLRRRQTSSDSEEGAEHVGREMAATTAAREPGAAPDVASLTATLKNLAEHPAWFADDTDKPTVIDAEPESQDPIVQEDLQGEPAEDVNVATVSADPQMRPTGSDWSSRPTGLAPFVSTPTTPKPESDSAGQATAVAGADAVPISNLYPRLKWIGRESCQALGRYAEIRSAGDGFIDRRVLKSMLEPLDCLIRNAVYYGIESGHDRLEASKSPVGGIGLTFHHGTDSRYLNIETDGLAVDPERMHRKAESLGLLKAGEQPSRGALLELLLAKDFTTAHVATQTAGFGVGLYEAARQLAASGCTLSLSPGRRGGLCFTIHFPD